MRTEYECYRIAQARRDFNNEVRDTRKLADEAHRLADKARKLEKAYLFVLGFYFGVLIASICFMSKQYVNKGHNHLIKESKILNTETINPPKET